LYEMFDRPERMSLLRNYLKRRLRLTELPI